MHVQVEIPVGYVAAIVVYPVVENERLEFLDFTYVRASPERIIRGSSSQPSEMGRRYKRTSVYASIISTIRGPFGQ